MEQRPREWRSDLLRSGRLGWESGLRDVLAHWDLRWVHTELASIRSHFHRRRGDATLPHSRVVDRWVGKLQFAYVAVPAYADEIRRGARP